VGISFDYEFKATFLGCFAKTILNNRVGYTYRRKEPFGENMSKVNQSDIEYIRAGSVCELEKFYILPTWGVAVPVCHNSLEAISQFLVSRGDYALPCELAEYPIVSSLQLSVHFPDYFIIQPIISITIRRPIELARVRERMLVNLRRDKLLQSRLAMAKEKAVSTREAERESRSVEVEF